MKLKAILVLVFALAFSVSPFLLPEFGGFDPELYPIPQVDPPVQPEGYAFAIWGVIYLWLVIHAVFGVFARSDVADWDRTRVPMIATLAIGAAWLPVAYVSAFWAFVLIYAMLIPAAMAMARAPARDRWWASAPLALYTGWLTAASSASLGLVGAGWGIVMGEVGWALTAIGVALIVTLIIHALRRDEWVYFTSVIWALVAIAVQNANGPYIVMGTAVLGAVIVTALMIRTILTHRFGDTAPAGTPTTPQSVG